MSAVHFKRLTDEHSKKTPFYTTYERQGVNKVGNFGKICLNIKELTLELEYVLRQICYG